MTADLLVSSVLPATEGMAYSELYSDPPGLVPLPEEEPLIAKSVAKRRNEVSSRVPRTMFSSMVGMGIPLQSSALEP